MLDYRDPVWASFDIGPELLDDLLAIGRNFMWVPNVVVDGPQIENGEEELDEVPDEEAFERAVAWIFDREGGFQNDPRDKGNYYDGELVGTKYGISAASWGGMYDIPNLTKEQAEAIYRQHYWLASNAHKYPWPLSLLVFDTAVLHGVGAAGAWLREVGPNPYAFAAKRLKVYVNSDNWHTFGNGWVRRLAALLEVIGNG